MQISLRRHKDENERNLEKFAKDNWRKTRDSLKKWYSLSDDNCAEIFQESLIILWDNIKKNKVEAEYLDKSSSTYFLEICKRKSKELLRAQSKYLTTSYEINPSQEKYNYKEEQVEKILSMEEDFEEKRRERETIVREIVMNLPSPCNELLWGFYRDGHSMKMLAEMFNYASENAVKVTKHRCCEKFRNRYNERMRSNF